MLVILGFLLTIFFGLLLTLLVVPKMNSLERLGASYVLGLGLLTLFMFFYALFGFGFTFFNTFITLIVPILALIPLTKKRLTSFFIGLKPTFSFGKLSKAEKIIIIAITFFLFYSLINTLYWPVNAWDALVVYDFRALRFADEGTLQAGLIGEYYYGYPLLTSLAHTWVYLLGGENPQFIYSFFFIAFGAMFYGALREFVSKTLCLVAVFFLVTTPVLLGHSTFAYTNLPYTVYFVMGTIYLYIWMVKQKRGYLALSALMVGLSTWTRSSEPFWLSNLVILVLYSLWKRKWLAPFFYSLLFFPIQYPWRAYTQEKVLFSSVPTQIKTSISLFSAGLQLERIKTAVLFINTNVIASWHLFFILFLIILIFDFKNLLKGKGAFLLGLILANFFLLVSGVYIATFTYPEWRDIPESVVRLSMFFIPLFVFYIFSSETVKEIFGGK